MLIPVSGYSQKITDIAKNNSRRYREALYLQTDRDIYVSGEQVWFKLYKLNAFTGKPGNYSHIVYVELLNHTGYPVNQIKLKIDRQSAASGFHLSDTLGTGKYLLRAYTNWMKNFREKDFAFKTISVINPNQDPADIYGDHPDIDTVFFYPEGGKFIAGINTKTGIKAVNAAGGILSVTGAVIRRNNDTVCMVSAPEGDLGFFCLTPEVDEQYRFIFQDKQGTRHEFPLGDIEPAGIRLIRTNEVGKPVFHFSIAGTPPQQAGIYYFILKKGGSYKYITSTLALKNNDLLLDRNELPPGLSDIILSDKDGSIISACRIYNPPHDSILIRISHDKKSYGTGAPVRVKVTTTTTENDPVAADLTVTVVKAGLTEEIRKNIRNREEYRSFFLAGLTYNQHSDVNDLLALQTVDTPDAGNTNLYAPEKIKYYPELENKLVSGIITDYTSNLPLSHAEMFFAFVGKTARCRIFRTDDYGKFFLNISETGNREIVIRPLNTDTRNYYVEFGQDFLPEVKHPLPGPFLPDTAIMDILEKAIITKQINDIFTSAQMYGEKENHDKSSDSYNFYGEPVHRIVLSDYIPLSDVREVIREIVPWVSVRKKKGKTGFQMHSEFKDFILNNPLVLVDGTPFTDIEQLLKLPASNIEAIDVINLRYFFGRHIFYGLIHFITTKGNLEPLDLNSEIFRMDYPLPDRVLNIQPPRSGRTLDKNTRMPDFRNTLYWNPGLQTGKNGETAFDFYTSDEEGTYILIIEGINPDGKTGTSTEKLIIKNK